MKLSKVKGNVQNADIMELIENEMSAHMLDINLWSNAKVKVEFTGTDDVKLYIKEEYEEDKYRYVELLDITGNLKTMISTSNFDTARELRQHA